MPYIIPRFEIATNRHIGERKDRSAGEVAAQIVPFMGSALHRENTGEVQARLDGLCVRESIDAYICTITRTR